MRRVLVGGREFTIPEDQTYIIRNEETPDFAGTRITTEFTFHPYPYKHVNTRTCERDVISLHNNEYGESIPAEDNWVDQPVRDLSDFLLVEKNPCAEPYSSTSQISAMARGLPSDNKYKKAPARKSAVLPKPMYGLDTKLYRERLIHPADLYGQPGGIEGKGKRRPMTNKFTSGTRVLFRNPINKKMAYATVVGAVEEMRGQESPGTILLCTDDESERFRHHEQYTGAGHGVMVTCKKAEVDEIMGDSWHTVPENVGVCVRKSFEHDTVGFPSGVTGRIVAPPDMDRSMVLISWNFSNDNFHNHEDNGGNLWNQCWQVPLSKISMCLLNYEKKVLSHWPAGLGNKKSDRKKEDICTVTGRSVNYVNEETGREQVLPEGTVVELLKNNGGSSRTWTCRIIGGCPDGMMNAALNISERYLRDHPSPDSFYRPGQVVEIVAKVDFRKKPLQGMKGQVILSTDAEGDVGIEFKEDIGAGSLDGIGREGHCIYIEASLVKSSE